MTSPAWAGPPPRRLSADRNSSYWHPYWSAHAKVFVGGEPITHVVELDVAEGWAKVFPQPLRFAGSELVTVLVRGEIEVRAPEALGPVASTNGPAPAPPGPPPRRITGDPLSPHWDSYWSRHARVVVAGVRIHHVLEVHLDAGWVRARTQQWCPDLDQFVTYRIRERVPGLIKILPPEDNQ